LVRGLVTLGNNPYSVSGIGTALPLASGKAVPMPETL